MSGFEIDRDGLRALYGEIGQQVQQIVNEVARDTADDDLDSAVDTLHRRLNAVDGLTFDRDWSQNAIETLRRGDDLTIELR